MANQKIPIIKANCSEKYSDATVNYMRAVLARLPITTDEKQTLLS